MRPSAMAAKNGSRPHALAFNYSYEVPKLSQKWDNIVAKVVFDNWQISGATSFISGSYGSITYSFTGVPTGALVGTGAISGPGSRVAEPGARTWPVAPVPDS